MNDTKVFRIYVDTWADGETVRHTLEESDAVFGDKMTDHCHVQLYMEWGVPDYNEPVLHVGWYPMGQRYLSAVRHLDGKPGVWHGNACFTCPSAETYPVYYQLKDKGKTTPDWTEDRPIPKPKGRVEMRWYCGRWEKYLKHTGWVPA